MFACWLSGDCLGRLRLNVRSYKARNLAAESAAELSEVAESGVYPCQVELLQLCAHLHFIVTQ